MIENDLIPERLGDIAEFDIRQQLWIVSHGMQFRKISVLRLNLPYQNRAGRARPKMSQRDQAASKTMKRRVGVRSPAQPFTYASLAATLPSRTVKMSTPRKCQGCPLRILR